MTSAPAPAPLAPDLPSQAYVRGQGEEEDPLKALPAGTFLQPLSKTRRYDGIQAIRPQHVRLGLGPRHDNQADEGAHYHVDGGDGEEEDVLLDGAQGAQPAGVDVAQQEQVVVHQKELDHAGGQDEVTGIAERRPEARPGHQPGRQHRVDGGGQAGLVGGGQGGQAVEEGAPH